LDTYNSGQVDLRRDVISGGSTGLIYLLPSGYVRKSAYPGITRKQSLRDIEHEHKIYQRLPHHDRLLKMMGYSIEDGLILEYMPNGNLGRKDESLYVQISYCYLALSFHK
jgi:hypothetical protein